MFKTVRAFNAAAKNGKLPQGMRFCINSTGVPEMRIVFSIPGSKGTPRVTVASFAVNEFITFAAKKAGFKKE